MSQMNLLRQRRFSPLFWTQFLGAFNDNFLKNALVMLITYHSTDVLGIPAGQMVSVAGGLFILPFFLFSATAGQLADKYEKGKLIRIIKIVEIGIMVLATIGFLYHQFAFLLFVLFLMGLHSTFFGPLKFSILPQHLEEREIIGGNALIEMGTFIAILIGTIAGGSLIELPQNGPLYVSIALLAVSVLGYLTSLRIPHAPAPDAALKVQWNPITPTVEIIKYARKNRAVFNSILGVSWFWFFGAAVLSLFPSYCKDVLKADSTVVTLFLACFSVGVGAGALLCEKLSRRSIELGLVPLGSIGMSIFAFDLFFSATPSSLETPFSQGLNALQFVQTPQGMWIVIDLICLALFSGLFIVPLNAFMQERSEVSHRSRIIAANNIINSFFMVVASLMLVALLKFEVSIPQIFLILAILNALVSAYIYLLVPEFLLRFAMWVLANIIYRLKVEGEENLPDRGPVILVCNHVSFVDWLIIGAASHRPVRFVMHYTFAKGPIGSFMQKRAKVIPIAGAKEDPEILAAAFEKMAEELESNHVLCVFPEGTITRDGELAPFRPGIEKVLARTPVPVVPMALCGMWGSFFSRKGGAAMAKVPKRFWSRVTLKIDKVIPPEKVTALGLEKKVREMLGDS